MAPGYILKSICTGPPSKCSGISMQTRLPRGQKSVLVHLDRCEQRLDCSRVLGEARPKSDVNQHNGSTRVIRHYGLDIARFGGGVTEPPVRLLISYPPGCDVRQHSLIDLRFNFLQ